MSPTMLVCGACGEPTIESGETFEGQRTAWYECPTHGRVDTDGQPRRGR